MFPVPMSITNSTDGGSSGVTELPNNAIQQSIEAEVDFPIGRANLMMAYDIESDITIIYGGWKNPAPFELGDTWSYDYDTDTYTNMSPTISPPVREVSGMVYDSQSDKIVLFGGLEDFTTSLFRNDTWTYDYNTNTWENVTSGIAPPARDAFSLVYDSESDRVILFGGGVTPKFNDTWAYDLETNTWEQMSPSNSPSARYFQSIAYDEESDRVILFSGRSDGAKVADTWAYDYNSDSWNELSISTQPVWRRGHFMTYDNESDSIVLFGGSDVNDAALDDTWLFDYNSNTWTQVNPPNSPYARLRHSMVYDDESDIIISFGGTDLGIYAGNIITTDTTWAYDTNANNWTQMAARPFEYVFSISLVSHNPNVPSPDESVRVLANIIGEVSAILQYNIGTADWTNVTMIKPDSIWYGSIPAQPDGTTVTYRVVALNTDNNEALSTETSYIVHGSPPVATAISIELVAIGAIVGVIVILLILIVNERR